MESVSCAYANTYANLNENQRLEKYIVAPKYLDPKASKKHKMCIQYITLASLFGTLSTDSKMVLDATLPSFNMDQTEYLCTVNLTKNNAVHHYTGFCSYFVFVCLFVCCTVNK